MSKPVSAIVFDLGNVLLPFSYEGVKITLNDIEPDLGTVLMNKYKNNYSIHRAHEKGEITSEEFINILLGWVNHKISRQRLIELYAGVFTENTELTSLLPLLKNKYTLVLLSNTNPIHQEHGWQKYGFLKHFDKLILSHEVKYYKPEPGIYEAVENFTRLKPEQHFYIDDIKEYVSAAIKRGWLGEVFINNKKLFEKFDYYGIDYAGE